MLSKAASIIFGVLFIGFILATIAYLETPQLNNNDTGNFLTSYPTSTEVEVSEVTETSGQDADMLIPILEDKFVEATTIDGYTVETYREYEVYQDAEGNIVKTVPTSNFNYIRYVAK